MSFILNVIKHKFLLFYAVMTMIVLFFPIYWSTMENISWKIFSSLCFVFGIFLFSFSCCSLCMSIKSKLKISSLLLKIISMLFLCLPVVIYIVWLIPYITVNKALTDKDVLAFFGTHSQEATSYFFSNIKLSSFVWTFLIFILFVISAIYCVFKWENLYKKTYNYIALLLGIIFSLVFIRNPLIQPLEKGIAEFREYQTFLNKTKNKNIAEKLIDKNHENGIYVVVIGESQNRTHMSVYGYNRPTTPFLDFEKNNNKKGSWIFFNNPYACYTHTVEALSWALTDINSFNQKKLLDSKNIMDVLNKNGYETWWISNKKRSGPFNVSTIVSQAQNQLWLNENSKKDTYDEVILNKLPSESKLKNQPVVIFIHLRGNHFAYRDRYPDKWNKFGNNMIDHYDSSILYNDYITEKIYKHFAKMKNFSAFIYIADHADDVNNGLFSHNATIFTWDMTKIPFFAFFSSNYIKNNSDKIKVLNSNKDKPFVNEMFFDFLLGVLNISGESYNPNHDFGNSLYNHDINDLSTLHGTKRLADEINDNILQYRSKIWLHRVNSLEKMQDIGKNYFGVELDIIYHEKENDFENSHDKTDLSKYPLSKTLSGYSWWHNFWFDFKNLTEENKVNSRKTLANLIRRQNISKDKIWLESQNWEALEFFTKSGWKTSYYMPYYNFETMTKEEIKKIKLRLEAISYSGKVKAISFAGKYYSFIISLKLNPKISLLTWFDEQTLDELKNQDYFWSILQNPKVKVVLVKEYGKYHR